MLVEQVRDELDLCQSDAPIQVEINGVIHDIHGVQEDSQGAYLVVDMDEEERLMR